MTFKGISRYDPRRPRKPETPAQHAQRTRSWRIFQLRALAVNCFALSPMRRRILRAIVDDQLRAIGADTTKEHEAKVHAEMRRQFEERIPF